MRLIELIRDIDVKSKQGANRHSTSQIVRTVGSTLLYIFYSFYSTGSILSPSYVYFCVVDDVRLSVATYFQTTNAVFTESHVDIFWCGAFLLVTVK